MTLAALVTIVFFLGLGISVFYPARWLVITYGIASIILGVLAIIGSVTVIHI